MKKQILTLTLMFTASLVANAQYSTGVAQLKNEHLAFATSAETMPTSLNYAQSTGRTTQPYTANTSNATFKANPSAKETLLHTLHLQANYKLLEALKALSSQAIRLVLTETNTIDLALQ